MAIKRRYSKTRGVRYRAVIDVRGKQTQRSFDRKLDAQRWESLQREKMKNVRSELDSPLKEATIAEYLEHCYEHSKQSGKTAATLNREEGTIRLHIVPFLGSVKLQELSPKMCDDWMHNLSSSRNLVASSVNRCRVVFSKFLSDAVRWQLIPSNPLIYVRPFRFRKSFKDFLTQKEMTQFLEFVAAHRPELLFGLTLLAFTGMRKGEARGLNWGSVDLQGRRILVRRSYCSVANAIRETTKSGKERVLPINSTLLDAMIAQRALVKGSNTEARLVIESFPWGSVTKLMHSLCKRAGVKIISLHGFRHSFASNLVMAGVPLYDVQALLGHSDFRVTQMYAHLSPDHLKDTTECLKFGVSLPQNNNVVSLRKKFS